VLRQRLESEKRGGYSGAPGGGVLVEDSRVALVVKRKVKKEGNITEGGKIAVDKEPFEELI